jgi:hypothetical protein
MKMIRLLKKFSEMRGTLNYLLLRVDIVSKFPRCDFLFFQEHAIEIREAFKSCIGGNVTNGRSRNPKKFFL